MEFRILGPTVIEAAGTVAQIARRQERCVIAALLLSPGRPVAVGRLAELLWADEPPASARDVIQTYVSRLRGILTPHGVTLRRVDEGYVLDIEPDSVDAWRFDQFMDAATANDVPPRRRIELLDEALGLWRGPALADIGPDHARLRLAARLEERRDQALLLRVDAYLQDGRHTEILGNLRELVAAAPLDERLAYQLLLALYRAGRRTQALSEYRLVRDRLRDALGLDPSTELQQLHSAILRDDPSLRVTPEDAVPQTPAPPVQTGWQHPAVAQLPSAVPDFVGRRAELAQLDDLLPDNLTTGSPLVISVVAGRGGIGKTALAVQWAHRVAHLFPDGQLFTNLHGFGTDGPTRPIDALTAFLVALGVPGDRIPVELDAAAALYRSMLAQRRMLVVLDNAADAEQIRPLLPGAGSCLVVVTTRNRLGALSATHGARRLTLGALPEPEALHLLMRLIGENRLAAEPETAVRLAQLCGYLPLALRIAAGQLVGGVGEDLAAYVAALTANGPLATLSIEDDPQASIRGTLDTSVARLLAEDRAVLLHCGLAPGEDLTASAVAALCDLPLPRAELILGRLVAAHLVELTTVHRYALHDLVRQYAAEHAVARYPEQERGAALRRLLDWYLVTVDAAARLVYPQINRLPLPEDLSNGAAEAFEDMTEALAWLNTERPNLVAAILAARKAGENRRTWRFADALRGYFWQSRYTRDWLRTALAAQAAAHRSDEPIAPAVARLNLGMAYLGLNRYPAALRQLRAAGAAAERAGWTSGQATCVVNLGIAYVALGDPRRAADSFQSATELCRVGGLSSGEANSLANLGWANQRLGRLNEAVEQLERAAELHRQSGSKAGEALAMQNLGVVYRLLGRTDSAQRSLTHALELMRAAGSRYGEVGTLHDLAELEYDTGRYGGAQTIARQALTLAMEMQDDRAEANLRNVLGAVHLALDEPETARAEYLRAAGLAESARTHQLLAESLTGLAEVHCATGDGPTATGYAERALAMVRPAGYRIVEADVLYVLAAVHSRAGAPESAARYRREAESIAEETGYRPARQHVDPGTLARGFERTVRRGE